MMPHDESVRVVLLRETLGTLLTAYIPSSSSNSNSKVSTNTSQHDSGGWGGGEERRCDQKVCFDREED